MVWKLPLVMITMVSLLDAANAQERAQKPATDPDKKICRREQSLGSFVPKMVCHTRKEWGVIDGSNTSDAEAALAKRRVGMPGLNTPQ